MNNGMNSPTSRLSTIIGVLVAIISLTLCAAGGYLAWKKASTPSSSAKPQGPSQLVRGAAGLIQSVAESQTSSFDGKPIPTGPEVMTQAKHLAGYKDWLWRKVNDAWRAGRQNRQPNPEAERVQTDAWRILQRQQKPSDKDFEEILKRAQALPAIEAGDPVMRLTLAHLTWVVRDSPEILQQYKDVEKGLRDGHYPLLLVAYAQSGQMIRLSETGNQKDADRLIAAGAETLAQAMEKGEVAPGEVIYAYHMLSKMFKATSDNEDICDDVCQVFQKHKNIDPWMLDILNGQNEINKAWKARGSDWAKTVSEPGWQGFALHLDQARGALTDAWRRHPEWPQAAALMITVTKGGRGEPGVRSRDWFDRAVAARMDFPEAYNALSQDMLPRWHGSTTAMAEFALECLNTNRFDTEIPFYYFLIINQSGMDMPPGAWRRAFRQPDVAANLDRMFEGYQEAPDRATERSVWQARRAVAQTWCGNYERARELMKTAAPEDQLDWTQVMSFFSLGRVDRKTFEAELRAFTGPLKETLARADALQCSGQAAAATALFSKAMTESKEDKAIFGYLRDRIANLELDGINGGNNENYFMDRLALHRALGSNQPKLAAFLIENGADLNTPASDGWLPVQIPLSKGQFDLVKLMVEHGAEINRTSSVSDTPLIMAIETNQRQMAEYLIAHGADLSLGAKGRTTPLYYAIMRNRPEMIDLLIQKGANINLCTEGFGTPLRKAAMAGNVELARMLLARGADPNLTASDVSTPLMGVGENGNVTIARLLLEKGANPNAVCKSFTALHYAAYFGQAEVARLLVEKGARLDLKESKGKTPLALARERKNEAVVKILEAAAGKP